MPFQQQCQWVLSVNHLSFKCLQMFKALRHLHKAIKWLTNDHKQAAEGGKAKTCSLCFSQFPFNLRHAFVLSLKAPLPLMASLLSFTLQWQHRKSSQQLDAVTKCSTEIYIHSAQIYRKKWRSWPSLRSDAAYCSVRWFTRGGPKRSSFSFRDKNQSAWKENYISLFSGNFGKHFNSPSVAPGIQV